MRRKVEDVMTTSVIVVGQQAPFKKIVRLLEECQVSALPVVDDRGVVVGVVSEADLLTKQRYLHGRAGVGMVAGRRDQAGLHKAAGTTAAEVMSSPPVTVSRAATVAEAARMMARHQVRRLPVVDDSGRLVGIVSRSDLLRVFLRADGEILLEVDDKLHHFAAWGQGAIDAQVTDGVVALRGQVGRHSEVALLTRMVEAVDGVVAVRCEFGWELDDAGTPPAPATPAAKPDPVYAAAAADRAGAP